MPFALSNPAVSDISVTAKEEIYQSPWLGKIDPKDAWLWADNFFLLVSAFLIDDALRRISLVLFKIQECNVEQ